MTTKQILEYINLLKPRHMTVTRDCIYDEDIDYPIRLYWNRSHGVNNILSFRTCICKDCLDRFNWLNDIFILTSTREINSFLVELTYAIKE